MSTEKNTSARKAWGYSESFMIAFELLIIGFGLEVIAGGRGISPHICLIIYIL